MNAKNQIAVVVIFVGSVLAAASEDKSPSRASEAEASIQAATNIVFKQWTVDLKGTKSQQFAVTDPHQVRRLASWVRLGVETGNMCEFLQQAKFEGPSGVVDVQFNEHYFVVVDPPSSKGYSDRTYEMPKQFYAQFRKLAKKHPWHVGKP